MSRWKERAAARAVGARGQPGRFRGSSLLLVLAVIGVTGVAVWHFASEPEDVPAGAAHRAATTVAPHQAPGDSGEPVLRLTAAAQRQNGIETAVLRSEPYQAQLRAYGTVLDGSALTALANKFADATAQVEIAEAKLAASKAAYGRAQVLFRNQQNMSRAEMQNAEASFRADQAAAAAAAAQLRSLAATATQDWGAVLGKDLAANGPLLARLTAREDFLVQVSLPPGAALARAPPTALIEPGSSPADARVPIRLVSMAPRVDPKIQGVSYLYLIAATSGVLPGMEVPAFLPEGQAAPGVLVPAAAIVWWQGRAWAYLRTGPETFARREIPTGEPAPDGSGGYIARDLPAGAEIVTRGAQSLLSEEFRAQIDVED